MLLLSSSLLQIVLKIWEQPVLWQSGLKKEWLFMQIAARYANSVSFHTIKGFP